VQRVEVRIFSIPTIVSSCSGRRWQQDMLVVTDKRVLFPVTTYCDQLSEDKMPANSHDQQDWPRNRKFNANVNELESVAR
jgi:hypothetical protein